MRGCHLRSLFAAAALGAMLFAAAPRTGAAVASAPRPLTAAEEEAAQLAVAYLHRGPEAWVERLDPEGPFGGLDRAEAVAEIGVRAGPPRGARWTLQTPGPGQPEERAIFTLVFPSGLEETLVLDLARKPGGWSIHRLRGLAEPWEERFELGEPGGAPASRESAAVPGTQGTGRAAGTAGGPATAAAGTAAVPAAVAAGIALLLATVLLVGWRNGRPRTPPFRRAAPVLALLLAFAAGLAVLAACGGDGDGAEGDAATPEEARFTRLGALHPLRRAMAEGGDPERLSALARGVPEREELRLAADLWRAEMVLQQSGLAEAEAVLADLPTPSPVPLGSLLRARLAFVRNQPEAAAAAYDEALFSGPDHDGLRLEAAMAMMVLGRSDEGEIGVTLLTEMGSRLADAWYFQTRLAVLQGKVEEGEDHLRHAWQLQPMEREDLLSSPLLAHVLARAPIFPLFELGSPAEPRVPPDLDHRRPLELPTGAESHLTGRLLQVEVPTAAGDAVAGATVAGAAAAAPARLTLPGGAVLAPDAAVLLAADGLRLREEEAALRHLPTLAAQVRNLDALAHPRRREDLLRTAHALARRHRWQDLVDLTSPIAKGDLDPVPGELAQLRAAALTRLERPAEARDLLVRLAHNDLLNQRRDPANLYMLAELAARNGELDLALKLMRRAGSLSPHGRSELRMRQIEMQKRLAAAPEVWETAHFRIVYPRLTGEKYARQLGLVLEEERKRLSRWIPPVDGAEPVEVHLYPVEEFLRAYSSSALVLGVYDGVVRVPFADLRSLAPELVAILSHELAHALIGQATDEKAPKWLHEGLAEHVQMSQDWANPIPDLEAAGHTIAFSVLEPILAGFAEPQLIEIAYGQAAWAVHYIEARHGVGALHRLLRAFRDGATTDEALQRALGMDSTGFHEAASAWARTEAPVVWPTEVRRYDHELDLPFERSRDSQGRLRRESSATGPRLRDPAQTERAMREWHGRYVREVGSFKRELGAVMGDLSRGQVLPHRQRCGAILREVDRLLAQPELFRTPSASAGHHLRSAFASFRRMAETCELGAAIAARAALRDAEGHLGAAARELQPYGLNP